MQNNQIKLGFVTSTTKDNVNSVFGIKNYFTKEDFDFVGNNTMVQNPKPHSDIYMEAIKKLNVNLMNVLRLKIQEKVPYLRIMQKNSMYCFSWIIS